MTSDARNRIPVDRSLQSIKAFLDSSPHDKHSPDTKKVDGYGATERLLEPRRKVFVTFAGGFEQPVCKGVFAPCYLSRAGRPARLMELVSGTDEVHRYIIPCATSPRALGLCTRHERILGTKPQ
jgi:hypothetical protein